MRGELDRLFPATSREAALLGQPMAELARMLAEPDAPEVGPALDALEDLLEALMHAAGWPGQRGRTP
ncbi:hypothetical protein ACNOYE_02140 [Nannocystaceae bacterium ST9]